MSAEHLICFKTWLLMMLLERKTEQIVRNIPVLFPEYLFNSSLTKSDWLNYFTRCSFLFSMSSFSVKFCFRVSRQIFFLILLFAKNVCKFIVFGFDSHVKLTLKYSAELLAFDEISILKGKKADGTKFSRVEFLSSLSFFFLSLFFLVFIKVYDEVFSWL